MTNQATGNNFQDLILNNGGVITSVSSDSSAIQGLQMTNQFALCANAGSTPVLVPYIAPMLLSPQTNKISLDGNNQDHRSQNGQLQLANNITIPSNLLNSGNLPLGLSYINLSSLTSQAGGGTAFPIQLALNTGSNQQFTLPLASITQLTNDLQISNTYTLAPQIKFEPELQTNEQMSTQPFQKDTAKQEKEVAVTEQTSNKRGRKKVIVRKNTQFIKKQKVEEEEEEEQIETKLTDVNNENEVMYDHKGRPFIYPCNQCSKKFTQNSRLTAHLRCHSGIRPYTCTQCGFSFTQKSYLIRHAAVHKEDRPFTCAKCLKTYKHYGSLANHRKLHCRENLMESNVNGTRTSQDCTERDDLDETIQQTIESVQMNHHNNFILAYSTNNSDLQSSTPIVFFNQNAMGSNNGMVVGQTQSELHLPGTGPVVFPSQELPSLSAVSLLPPNRSAINELKAITTHHVPNVDVDEVPVVSTASSCSTSSSTVINSSSIDFQQHIKQESTYFTVPHHQSDSGI